MYCQRCGSQNDDNAFRCTRCGEVIQDTHPQPRPADLGDSQAMRMILPVGRSGLAIAAGYLGFFALLLFPAPIALMLGILAVRDIKRHPKKHGMGRAVFGIAMGALGTAALVIMFVVRVASRHGA